MIDKLKGFFGYIFPPYMGKRLARVDCREDLIREYILMLRELKKIPDINKSYKRKIMKKLEEETLLEKEDIEEIKKATGVE